MINKVVFVSSLAIAVAGCGSMTPVTPIGPDTYMIANKSNTAFATGGEMLAALYQEANSFCIKQNKSLMPVSTSQRDGAPYTKATGELHFRCLNPGDPGLGRPTMESSPDVTIQIKK